MRVLVIACALTVGVLSLPAEVHAGQILDCLFGCSTPAPVTYAPAYVAPTCAPSCTSCVPRSCQYMPTTVYRALYQPTVMTAYRPVATCNTCTSYAVTTYRPVLGWSYRARLVPYTTYRPAYAVAPVAAGVSCNPCVSYSPCYSCDPCGSGSCGAVTYGATTFGCASCAAPTSQTPAPYAGGSEAGSAAPSTFKQETQKPAAEPDIEPIPRMDTQLNSMPAPRLPDPRDRTATRSNHTSSRVVLTASSIESRPIKDKDGWQAASD